MVISQNRSHRGWQDRPDRHDHWNHVLRLRLLCAYFCVYPCVGDWWRARHCWVTHDPQVRV